MKKSTLKSSRIFLGILLLVSTCLVLFAGASDAYYDPPHTASSGVLCDDCHGESIIIPGGSPFWTDNKADSAYNAICLSRCHTLENVPPYDSTCAPPAVSHAPGGSVIKCTVCHHNHEQEQVYTGIGAENRNTFFLATGTAASAVYDSGSDTTTITYSVLDATDPSGDWAADLTRLAAKSGDGRGALLIPDRNNRRRSPLFMITAIDDPAASTIIVKGNASNATAFAIIYGQVIRAEVNYVTDPPITGMPAKVKFYDRKGANSFVSTSPPYGICQVCHESTSHWRNDGSLFGVGIHSGMDSDTNCSECHSHSKGFAHGGGGGGGAGCDPSNGIGCHGEHESHTTHTGSVVGIDCGDCHDTDNYPNFRTVADPNANTTLATTDVCDNCHSGNGVANAKDYFDFSQEGDRWSNDLGEESFCGSCHDGSPGYNGGDAAPDIIGNNTTYGYFITGHGKPSGNYNLLSWQDGASTGNPAANQSCSACHDLSSKHFNTSDKRLKVGFENDQDNSNCNNCHPSAENNTATADPQWYTESDDYETSAHRTKKCTECHDVHGAAGTYVGMTINNRENLCYQCHTDGMVQNANIDPQETGNHDGGADQAVLTDSTKTWAVNSLVGKTVDNITDGSWGTITANDATTVTVTLIGGTENDWDDDDTYAIPETDTIQDAFGMAEKHDLGTSFTANGKNYTLQCVSCHNVHLITGRYWQAEAGKTPVTRFPPDSNLQPWGDGVGEKMDTYAGTGTYRTPNGDVFDGSQLPDYATFCLDCHAQPAGGHANFGISWGGDPHGTQSANNPNGYGTCPNWWACGKAEGWDGDDCVASDPADCWPVMTRGLGDQLWSRSAYTHEDRIGGANFTLSCSDCHEAHGSNNSSMVRSNPNNGTGSVTWNTMCNNCHYYYSDWHAGMSCGNASCHTSNSIHRAGAMTGSGSTRTFNRDLVLHYAFNNNLKDSGNWQMDGKWMDDLAGSFTTGKSGQAVVLNGGKNIQVGTENSSWSTDEGMHGTWKYTEMKFNTTLESWVYPTDNAASEYIIFSKHIGVGNNGGYVFELTKVNGTLRAAFRMAADNNGVTQDGRAGVRGAYSSVSIPLNTWTHLAVTFDTAGPDRDPGDPSVGRIRIYVNGEDVTTSDSSGDFIQPGAGETSIYAFTENNGWNQAGVCFDDSWCAGEFSVGGFYGWQNEFIGRLDDAMVWNITKDATYFTSYDSQAGPYISKVEGLIGGTDLTVTFSEGAYANTGMSGALQASDFTLTDTNTDNARTIVSVTHTPGEATATVTMSAPLIAADIGADTLAFAAANSAYDEYDAGAGTAAAEIGIASTCPTSPVSFDLNDAPGSSYVMDSQNILYGAVNGGASTLTGSEYSGGGDGSDRYIMFDYNTTCLQADRKMTLETRIKPTGIPGDTTTNYIRRVLARDGNGNYQMSVWRNESWANFTAPAGEASIALWVNNADDDGDGTVWNIVLSNYTGAANGSENDCPIVSDHWYYIKVIWDSDRAGSIPGRIYIDDQGTDGTGAGENWSGELDCTDLDQSLNNSANMTAEGWEISKVNANFAIGVNRGNTANNLFNGLIDWIQWKDSVD